MPRLPQIDDFDKPITVTVTKNPESGRPPANVLVLLHGLGDSEEPFTKLGSQLNLPYTCVLAVRGLQPLPFDLPGYHWGDDINVNQGTGSLDPDAGFQTVTRVLLQKVLRQGLMEKCGFRPREVVLWGFGQGGMAAVALAEAAAKETEIGELGGVITIGGPLPESIASKGKGETKSKTPMLMLGGASGTMVTDEQVERAKRVFEFVERVKWRRSGDGMPRDRGEMMPIMQFLARRLRAGGPEGSVEVGI